MRLISKNIKLFHYLAVFYVSICCAYGKEEEIFEVIKEAEKVSQNLIHIGKGKELAQRFHFDGLLKGANDEKGMLENYILLSEGDLLIEGDLFLDNHGWSAKKITTNIKMPDHYSDEVNIAGVIILGNLIVKGAVININGDFGPTLLVKGDLHARNLIAGGSDITIHGDTVIEEVIYGHYNHGTLQGYGNVTAMVLINDDHSIGFSGDKNIAHSYHNDYLEEVEEEDEYRIASSLQPLLRQDIVYYEEILEYLMDGHSILKDSQYVEALPDVLDQHFFDEKLTRLMQNKHVASGRVLQRIPRTYRSETLGKKAVAFEISNIEFLPKEWMTAPYIEQIIQQSQNHSTLMEFIPEKFKTRALCLEAAKRGSLSISDVPKHLLKDEALMLEIIRHNSWQYRYLSDKLAVQEAFMMLALAGGEYDDVLDVLAVLDERHPAQNIFQKIITKGLDSLGLDLLEKLPGKAVTTEIFEYAQEKFHSQERWDNLVKAHSTDFWKINNNEKLSEISSDIGHEARYDDALNAVWSHFWTDAFLINLLKHTVPYAPLDEIPYAYWTPALIEAAQQHDRYGYYQDYIQDYEQWQKRQSRPTLLNKVMGLFER